MMYSNKFVVSILVDSKPCQELSDCVAINFGSSYSIRFRNKNNKRALVQFTIDGENVSGGGYVIPKSDYIDIHRHYDKDVGFKFVDIDSPEAVDFGKNGPGLDKGIIEAKFYLEKEMPSYPNYYPYHNMWINSDSEYWPDATNPMFNVNCNNPLGCCPNLQTGVTVEGAVTGQNFHTVAFNHESDFVLIRLLLKGFNESVSYCGKCGGKRRKNDNFCCVCGNKY